MTLAQTLKQQTQRITRLRKKAKPYIRKAQATFDMVFPPPKTKRADK